MIQHEQISDLTFDEVQKSLHVSLLDYAHRVDVGEWHSQKVDSPLLITRELMNVYFGVPLPASEDYWAEIVKPNMPFAEAQFQDRVSGIPSNPPPSHKVWPWAHAQHQDEEEKFSHTYPERLWPKHAGENLDSDADWDDIRLGIRYKYGDLADVVNLLWDSPRTRQAYIPIWFPEDTGAVHGERVPCTLGYHLMMRANKLHIFYPIRSVDFVRHFRDDVYMAGRLCQWVRDELVKRFIDLGPEGRKQYLGKTGTAWTRVLPGTLTMWIGSLHCMTGDLEKLTRERPSGYEPRL